MLTHISSALHCYNNKVLITHTYSFSTLLLQETKHWYHTYSFSILLLQLTKCWYHISVQYSTITTDKMLIIHIPSLYCYNEQCIGNMYIPSVHCYWNRTSYDNVDNAHIFLYHSTITMSKALTPHIPSAFLCYNRQSIDNTHIPSAFYSYNKQSVDDAYSFSILLLQQAKCWQHTYSFSILLSAHRFSFSILLLQ